MCSQQFIDLVRAEQAAGRAYRKAYHAKAPDTQSLAEAWNRARADIRAHFDACRARSAQDRAGIVRFN